MPKAFLIHGWEGRPEEGWRPYLKKELTKKGFEVFVPAMPDTKNPKMSAWLKHLKKIAGSPTGQHYFVGHSLGCITILRYLESLKSREKTGGAVLVAGFTSNLGYKELSSFFARPINWRKIKSRCPKFTAIHSDNDPYASLHYADFFREKLGARIVIERNKKHFSGGDGITKLPSALQAVLRLSQ